MADLEVNFVFLREGTSDDGLIPHLRSLLSRAGADSAVGSSRAYSGSVAERLERVLNEESRPSLIFVHRDSDSSDATARRSEILDSARKLGLAMPIVPVVPVQELEAWLLLDEAAIREVAGNPAGRVSLDLPKISAIERCASPKEVLERALIASSGKSGRRLKKEKRSFTSRREVLLQRLDLDGNLPQLPAWQRLVDDVNNAVAGLRQNRD
ncbi:DUF4276 family protein [Janibacter sp. CX7]|uniref:DUF4276 family protein n=1 Tax=Janibacter sp. CX7 TaxID=2963431 RepID=UPI0020CBFB3B|nr:DUF4276 family protein [Janibacter sp. CX7]UTT65117.1 DUF4276 family protein [Janibacter sp. CX7]